jgi:hypothetical protein
VKELQIEERMDAERYLNDRSAIAVRSQRSFKAINKQFNSDSRAITYRLQTNFEVIAKRLQRNSKEKAEQKKGKSKRSQRTNVNDRRPID